LNCVRRISASPAARGALTDQFKKMQMARRTAVKLLKPKHKASGRKNEKSGHIMNTLPRKD
jgi:hypothetical protein